MPASPKLFSSTVPAPDGHRTDYRDVLGRTFYRYTNTADSGATLVAALFPDHSVSQRRRALPCPLKSALAPLLAPNCRKFTPRAFLDANLP